MTRAYSYVRFSTPEQAKGDSLRRQTEAAETYAKAHNLTLDTELTFQDLGVSAFKGSNAEAALGRFVDAVDTGRVAQGSYLLLENLDRLSRDKIMPALNRFSSLLEKGIVVVTLADGKRYDADSLNNLPDLMLSLLVMARAHEESATKSARLREVWEQRRARARNGHAIGDIGPTWLRLDDKGKWQTIPERVKVVRRIFEMADQGHGKASIAARLNEERIPTLRGGKAWLPVVVRRLLSNPATIGTFTPSIGEPVEDFFPAILDKDLFYRVRMAPPGASGKGSRPMMNMLAGLVYCAKCGERMAYHPMTSRGKRYAYLRCQGVSLLKICDAKMVPYHDTVEELFATLDTDQAWIGMAQQPKAGPDPVAIGAELDQTVTARERLTQALEVARDGDIVRLLVRRLEQNEASVRALQADLEEAKAHQVDEAGPQDVLNAIITIAGQLKDADEETTADLRIRLNAGLKRLISRIEVVKDKPMRIASAG